MLDFPLVFLCVCPLHQLKLIHKTTHEYLLRKRHWAFKILGGECSDDNGQYLFSSVTQSCTTFCNPMNRSRPGLPVHHQLPEFTQTQVHQVGDAIQPSHCLSSPSPTFNFFSASGSFPMSQLFTSGGQRIAVSYSVSVLPQIQYQSFQ